jgi:peptidoglycan/LPS O-acetylase OafA/YrhL
MAQTPLVAMTPSIAGRGAVGTLPRNPSIDGLRAVSILLVIFSHVLQTYHWTQSVPFVWRLVPGASGVSVFFVVSGYLITTLLLKERTASGRISLRGFYFRRLFRIVPAFLVYVSAVAVLNWMGVIHMPWSDFGAAFFYVSNYVSVQWALLHTWSLSVEEQFYLLFPLLLVSTHRPTLLRVLTGALCLSIVARLFNQVFPIWPLDATYSFEGRADQLAFGCLCAIFQHHASFEKQEQLRRIAIPMSAALFCISIALPIGALRTLLFNTFSGAGIALVVYSCATQPAHWLSRVLGTLPLRALGLISYSLYLWQQIWMTPAFHLSLPVALAGALACGTASYWLVEKPGLKLRHHIQQWNKPTQ